MIKIFCNVCHKYKKLKSTKKIFKKEESIKMLKILGLITNIEEYQEIYNHFEGNISQ